MEWIIYIHTNKKNGKSYIGQTKQTLNRRWRNGAGYTRYSKDAHFARAINKYGWDQFIHEILEDKITTQDKANERETFWIRFYDSVKNGYNEDYGGNVREWSEERRLRASLSHKGRKLTGVALENVRRATRISAKNPERNKKISQALSGRKLSESHRLKISQNASKRMGETNSFFGKHHTDEQKEKYRLMFGKPVICLETAVRYDSANEAGELLGVSGGSIRCSCRLGIQTKIGKKWFHFFYQNGEKPTFLYNNIKQVINVETNELFENLIDAAQSIGKTSKLIGQCCNGICQTAGGYHWMFYCDYKNASEEYLNKKRNENIEGKGRKKRVRCIETNAIYESCKTAERITGICYTSIAKVCNKKQNQAGGFHWEFVE